ncbi:MAG: methylated-DNA--[protein]-cysteine S-methyltransferase [Candidatus Bathyarchaeota archaeon]|nr:methylated-DNA--[protein]-cysteine S-methyltransferase [Candidatus Bathyarchaeota archaeon]
MMEIYTQKIGDTWFAIALNQQKIASSSFGEDRQKTIHSVLNNLPLNVPFQAFEKPTFSAERVFDSIKRLIEGADAGQGIVLAMDTLPQYTQKVLKATAAIPLGYVTSYGAIAKTVGGSARAVGNVMASNPFVPIVPCHRVVRSNLTLGGYGGGLKVKQELLYREKRGFNYPTIVDLDGGELEVFPVEFVLKELVDFGIRK